MIKKIRRESLIGESEVDLTPLIDCVFLLLIFFMVTTVFIEVQGMVVDLPTGADQEEEQQQQKKDVNIRVTAEGNYTVAGENVSSTGLASAIKSAMDLANNRSIIIQGNPEAPHKSIVFAMDMATSVGAEYFAFAIEEQE